MSIVSLLKISKHTSLVSRLALALSLLIAALMIAVIIAVSLGPVSIPFSATVSVILSHLGIPTGVDVGVTDRRIIDYIRLPRIIVAGMVGLALALSGATMQALFRNPMADPGIIGVSAGGAAGAVLSIALGFSGNFYLAQPLLGFAGSMGAAFLVYFLSIIGGRFSMSTLLLVGIAVSSFLGAIISTVLIIVPDTNSLREIVFWLAGGLDSRTWEHVQISAPFILTGSTLLMLMSRELNLLMIGDDEARSMGISLNIVRPILLVLASLITGVAVSVSGTIAFVGLIVPHIIRLVVGPDHRILMPVSALGGAVFMILADTLARIIIEPAEFSVGIITSLIGAPFFLFLLIANKRNTGSF
ncbi:MAG: iron ABC transporter permease [Dehalococcoidia bacterium]|nr:iron ABC transporter permease [Dehalococcoidia bacterium]